MGRKSEETFFQRRHEAHENKLNITNYQGNENQIMVRDHLTPVRMAMIQKTRNNQW